MSDKYGPYSACEVLGALTYMSMVQERGSNKLLNELFTAVSKEVSSDSDLVHIQREIWNEGVKIQVKGGKEWG